MEPPTTLSQDAETLVLWKPAGLASEQRAGGDSVLSRVMREFPDAKLPHRLDAVTCGILVVCLTPQSIAFANASIRARRWDKYYLARVAAPSGRDPAGFLGRHRAFLSERGGRAHVVRSGGKPAWLEVLAIDAVPGRTDRWHLLVRLLTGRFHQVRVMCAELGLPIAGDALYDPAGRDPSDFYLEHIVLKYEDPSSRAVRTAFAPEAPGRDRLARSLSGKLAELVSSPASFELRGAP